MSFKAQAFMFFTLVFVAARMAAAESGDRAAFKAAMDECLTSTGVARPERGTKSSEEDRAKLKACLDVKGVQRPERGERGGRPDDDQFHAALRACAEENNLKKPERGVRPSEEDRAKMDACLQSKGISKPEHPRHSGNE